MIVLYFSISFLNEPLLYAFRLYFSPLTSSPPSNYHTVVLVHESFFFFAQSEGTQNPNLKEHKHPPVHCSIIYNLQDMEAAQVPITRGADKTTAGHLHNRILHGHKKTWWLFFNLVKWEKSGQDGGVKRRGSPLHTITSKLQLKYGTTITYNH